MSFLIVFNPAMIIGRRGQGREAKDQCPKSAAVHFKNPWVCNHSRITRRTITLAGRSSACAGEAKRQPAIVLFC
jgi:hypothetical protein